MNLIPNEQDVGPYRIDHVLELWTRIARTIDALQELRMPVSSSAEVRMLLEDARRSSAVWFDYPTLSSALHVLARQDNMHVGDWLRMKAAESAMPRRKPPAAVELQIRLQGVQCERLVAKTCRHRHDDNTIIETHRVTIRTVRGDVVSAEDPRFSIALDGAIKMAAARDEDA